MHKRKITGIMPYGQRLVTQGVVKMQEGGVAFARGYNWREDPYELMLLKQRADEENMRIRSSGRYSGRGKNGSGSGSTKTPTDAASGKFGIIKGGHQAANMAANARFQEMQSQYFEKVKEMGPEFLGTDANKNMYQQLENVAAQMQEKLVSDKAYFTSAMDKKSEEDKNAFVISGNNNILVKDAEGMKSMALDEYILNPEKYQVQTYNQLASWREFQDVRNDHGIVDEFITEGSLSANTIDKSVMDLNKDSLNYYVDQNGSIVPNTKNAQENSKGVLADKEQWETGISNVIHGKDFYDGMGIQGNSQLDASNRVYSAMKTIYSDIMTSGAADRSRLEASLTAEALKNNIVKATLMDKKTLEEKKAYLETAKQSLLLTKVYGGLNSVKKGGGGGADGAGGTQTIKANSNVVAHSMQQAYDGKEVDRWIVGTDVNFNGSKRVTDLSSPLLKNRLQSADLLLIEDSGSKDLKNNRLTANATLTKYGRVNGDIYLASGEKITDAIGAEKASALMSEYSTLAKDKGVHMVFLPTNKKDNQIVADKLAAFNPVKLESRKKFLIAAKLMGLKVTTKAEELLPGNTQDSKVADYNSYVAWLKSGSTYASAKKEFESGTSNITGDYLESLSIANDELRKATESFRKNIPEGTYMQAYWMPTITFDDDGVDLISSLKPKSANMIKTATPAERKFLQDVNGVDSWNLGMWNDHIHTMNVLIRVKPPGEIAAGDGDKVVETAQLDNITNTLMMGIDSSYVGSNPDISNVLYFLTQ